MPGAGLDATTIDALTKFGALLGFPALVSLILLFKLDRSLRNLTAAIWELSGREGGRRHRRET
jgi:hypothetical protein